MKPGNISHFDGLPAVATHRKHHYANTTTCRRIYAPLRIAGISRKCDLESLIVPRTKGGACRETHQHDAPSYLEYVIFRAGHLQAVPATPAGIVTKWCDSRRDGTQIQRGASCP